MKLLVSLLIPLFAWTTLAQAKSPEFEETAYVIHTTSPEAIEDLETQCAWAAPYLPLGVDSGATAEAFSLHTRKVSGEVVEWEMVEVGNFTACKDAGELVMERGFQLYDFGVLYRLNIDGRDLMAGGSIRVRTPKGFLEGATESDYGMSLVGVTAGVWSMENELPHEQVGSMTSNILVNAQGIPGYNDGAIIVLRLFEPLTEQQKFWRDYFRKIGLLDE